MESPNLKTFDKVLLYAVRYGLFFVFILPFIVVLSYLYPWVSGKIWGLEIMVEILFPIYVLLAFRRKEYRPAVNAFLYAILVYFAVQTLSMLIGDMPHRSFWDKPDRLTGLFFQYHLLALFLMAGGVWRGIFKQPVAVTVIVAAFMAVYGFGQAYFGWWSGAGGDRGSASFGNPSYLGQYLVPHVFLTIWLLWTDRARGWRWLWMSCGVLILLGIMASKSRGALLGVLIGVVVAALLLAFKGEGRTKKWSRSIIIGIAAAGLVYLAGNYWGPTNRWLYNQRLSISYFQESTGSRKLLIENVVKGIKARPVLGWGPENFESAFYFYYDPTTLRYSDYESRQDRPHNLILEILVNLGVVGLLAYAAMFFFGWRLALRIKDDKTRLFAGSMLMLATVAHLGANLFIFDTPISYVMLYVQLALLAIVITPAVKAVGPDDLRDGAIPAAVVMAALSIWSFWYGVSGTMAAGKITAALIIALQSHSQQISADQFAAQVDKLMAIKTPYQERDIRAVLSNMTPERGSYRQDALLPTMKLMAKYEYDRAPKHPHDYVNALVTGSAVLGWWPRTPEEQAALEEALARMIRLAPNRQEVWWISAQVKKEKGDLQGAEADLQHAVDLDPGTLVSSAVYARFLIETNQIDKAMAFLKDKWQAIRNNSEANNALSGFILQLFDERKYDDLLSIYDASVRQGAQSFEISAAGALAALINGDEARALTIADDAKQKFPDKAQMMDQLLEEQKRQLEQQKSPSSEAPAPAPAQ